MKNGATDLIPYLQNLIYNINKSISLSQLKNEDLKNKILSEIIECQQKLLVKSQNKDNIQKENLKKSVKNPINFNEIYDEWKVLAMVVDRICFFTYLFLWLLIISLIYFLNAK